MGEVELMAVDSQFARVIAQLLENGFSEEELAYGVKVPSDTSVECERIGNKKLHQRLPIQSGMKYVLLNDRGEEVGEPKTISDMNGEKGQVMVKIPGHYYKFIDGVDGSREVWLSEFSLKGYKYVPDMYVSAFEASIDRERNCLASVVNKSARYRGGDNKSEWDNTYRTLLGRPITNKNLNEFRTLARNRSIGDDSWNCQTYEVYRNLYWLFVVEYATLNSQKDYNPELSADGYHQGGLGMGATTLTANEWSTFNGTEPILACGSTIGEKISADTVVKTVIVQDDASFKKEISVASYRGVENIFGHVWKSMDGAIVTKSGDRSIGNIGVILQSDKSKYSEYDEYDIDLGQALPEQGVGYKHFFGENGDIFPTEVQGDLKKGFCDYYFSDNSVTEDTTHVFLTGGAVTDGASAGLTCMMNSALPEDADLIVGTRLCYIPKDK